MGLFDFFKKPKWKNSSSSVRLKAVEEMTFDDLETLLEVIREDSNQQVRLTALMKIDDRQIVESLSRENLAEDMMEAVREKLDAMYVELLVSGAEEVEPAELFSGIANQKLIANIAIEAESVDIRCLAVAAIDDPQMLYELLVQHIGKKPALAAVKKIDDAELLSKLAEKAVNKSARAAALRKLASLENRTVETAAASEPNQEAASVEPPEKDAAVIGEQRDNLIAEKIKERQKLCLQVETLRNEMGDEAAQRFAELDNLWPLSSPELDNDELQALQQRYDAGAAAFRNDLAAWKTEQERMAQLNVGCQELEKALGKDNVEGAQALLEKHEKALKGSNWQWLKPGDLAGRFATLREQLALKQEQLAKKKEQLEQQNRAAQENAQALIDICVQMEELIEAPDRIQAEKQAGKLGELWKKLAAKAGEKTDELSSRFQAAVVTFREKKEQFYKEQEWEQWNNKSSSIRSRNGNSGITRPGKKNFAP